MKDRTFCLPYIDTVYLIALKYLLLLLLIISKLNRFLIPLKSVKMLVRMALWDTYAYANIALPNYIHLKPCAGRYAIYIYQVKREEHKPQ